MATRDEDLLRSYVSTQGSSAIQSNMHKIVSGFSRDYVGHKIREGATRMSDGKDR